MLSKKLLVLPLLLVACSTGSVDSPLTSVAEVPLVASTESTAAGSTTQTTLAPEPSDTSSDPEDQVDPYDENAAVFVAALEESFVGTSFEGAVLESPEVFIAAAEVICIRLDAGDDIDGILQDYLDGLLSNADSGADTVSENEAVVVAGGVLGASLELFCPRHRGLIED